MRSFTCALILTESPRPELLLSGAVHDEEFPSGLSCVQLPLELTGALPRRGSHQSARADLIPARGEQRTVELAEPVEEAVGTEAVG